jgi:hypothetical protein
MDTRYRSYLRECACAAHAAWRRHEEITVVVSAVLTFVAAAISVWLLPLHFKDGLGWAISAFLGFWLVFIFIFVSPYLLWRSQRITLFELNKQLVPKLNLIYGTDRIFRTEARYNSAIKTTEIRIGVHNVSSVPVNNVEVILANITSEDCSDVFDVNRPIKEDNSHGVVPININGKDTKYYMVVSHDKPVDPAELDMPEYTAVRMSKRGVPPDPKFIIGGIKIPILEGKLYRLKIRVSGSNSPAEQCYFFMQVDSNGDITFEAK